MDAARRSNPMARILVVDDEPKLVDFVCRALAADGFSVHGVTNGARALDLIRAREFDLVVLDLLMEGVDGLTVLERVTASKPHLPVLVVSARSDVETKVRCFELGAADYMTKPFALAELCTRIGARLRTSAPTREAMLRCNGYLLDPLRRIVHVGEADVQLSEREFLLLQHLMRHPGEVLSRAELREQVWGLSFDPGTNVVDVCVRRLRAKLGNAAIVTVRNVGYYLPVA
jgi:DNA-binding response OmpR family regulator